ncbi:MAG: glycoside hydrolase family 3 C-terminal domain-containing protein [Bacilli bacterium]|nr:glycoside hydrolase family 3 C-terminal domain-containing protein [Bacilli bacterium]
MKKKLLIPIFLAGMAIPALASSPELKGAGAAFIGEIGERAAYIAHASKVNGQMADEGFVLLKNDGTFPMEKGSKITVVGKASINLARGGAGSGAGSTSQGVTSIDLQKSLTDAGFEVNETSTNFYKSAKGGRTNGNDGWKGNSEVTIGETPIDDVKANTSLMDSWDEFNDLAIQVITREGSEGCDVLTIDATDSVKFGASEKHALELSDNEQALYDELKEHFDSILILINSSNIFECDQFQKDDQCAGILWIGNPGDVGPGAVGRILCGDVNPSGRTVDTWTRDFTKDPTFQNFSDNRHNTGVAIPNHKGRQNHQSADTMLNADGNPMKSYGTDKNGPTMLEDAQYKVVNGGINGVKPASYVSYEEGIYVDYRYHETRYADMLKTEGKDAADAWYDSDEGVVYPFGYGLSYTKFRQKIVKINPVADTVLNEDSDLIEVSVLVKNTGSYAGKDVVQLYWKAPYTAGGIEKADHVLCAFGKTEVLAPGAVEVVNLTFHLQDVANYDYKDANENGHKGYELDEGDYSILCMKNAHESYDSMGLKVVAGGIQYTTDRFTGHEVKNRFTDRGFYSSMPGPNDIEFTEFSRADFAGTFPHYPTFEDRKVKAGSRFEEFLTHEYDLAAFEEGRDYEYTPEAAHRTAADGANWSQVKSNATASHPTKLIDLKDKDITDPAWDSFINEFKWSELMTYVESNKMASPGMSSVGKSGSSEGDGPQKFNIMWWVSSPIVAATFNQKLAHEQGECIGMESQISGKSGWWGSAVNTHRSPFGGRNFEYYSADPFLMGRIAAQVVGAATDRGVYAYFKHFAVNDQEKNRESGISFVNEQALREIYLKSFQMVFEEGKSLGVMGSYNRLGLMETAASYPLMTEVLRGEWGFKGSVLSDMTHSGNGSVNFKCYECVTPRVLAGCNNQLDSNGFSGQVGQQAKWDDNANGGKGAPVCVGGSKGIAWSLWNACREAVKQHMYMCLNSTAMQRGMTQVVGQTDAVVKVGEAVEYDVVADLEAKNVKAGSSVDVYNSSNSKSSKTISTIDSVELNNRCELPDGLELEDGVISGAFEHVDLGRIDVVINVTFSDNSKGKIAYKYVIDAIPVGLPDDYEFPPENVEPVKPEPEKKGCGGSVAAASALIATIAVAGAALLASKRKED